MGYEDINDYGNGYDDYDVFEEVIVDKDKCIACLKCALLCPATAITVEETAQIDPLLCRRCGECYKVCDSGAIILINK